MADGLDIPIKPGDKVTVFSPGHWLHGKEVTYLATDSRGVTVLPADIDQRYPGINKIPQNTPVLIPNEPLRW